MNFEELQALNHRRKSALKAAAAAKDEQTETRHAIQGVKATGEMLDGIVDVMAEHLSEIAQAKAEQEAEEERVRNLGCPPEVMAAAASINGERGSWGSAFARRVPVLSPSGSITVPDLLDGIASVTERPRRLLEVIPRAPKLFDTNKYAFLQETERTHAAAAVADGAKKPSSTYTVDLVERDCATIAHLTPPFHRNMLSDARQLSDYIDLALSKGVELALEDEIVNGDGTNLTGLLAEEDIQPQTFETDVLTTTRKAITLLEDAEIDGGMFVFAPADWETIELLLDATDSFYLGGPIDRAKRLLWGKPVITCSALDAGTGLLVDFAGSTRIWEREGTRIDWSENYYDPAWDTNVGASDFELNQIRFRGEGRFGFGVLRPAGVVSIELTDGEG